MRISDWSSDVCSSDLTAQRRVNLIALCCIVSWRIFWLTMIRRSAPRAPPEVAFTVDERLVLTKISQQWRKPLSQQSRLPEYLICLARLGGYLARAHDPQIGRASCRERVLQSV